MNIRVLFLCLAALIPLSPGAAIGQEKSTGPSAGLLENFLKRFPESDLDKDGTLTKEEVREFRQKQAGQPQPVRTGGNKRDTSKLLPPTHANVAYGDDPQQVFDIWLAKTGDGSPAPFCLGIHGGGFMGGDKSMQAGTAQQFVDAGISFASLNYRLTKGGQNPYPIAMMDCARALQFIRSKADEWNLDASRVASYGGSAGAGISLWLAFHDDLAEPDASDPIARQSTRLSAVGTSNGQSTYDMRTFADWFAVPDLKPHPALKALYAVKSDDDWKSELVTDLMTDASPITHLTADDVPVYMDYTNEDVPVDATTDGNVWVHHIRLGQKLKEAMGELGLECTVSQDGSGKIYEYLIRQLHSAK